MSRLSRFLSWLTGTPPQRKEEKQLPVTVAQVAPSPLKLGAAAPRDAYPRWPDYQTSYFTPERILTITRNADVGLLAYQMGALQEITGRDGLIQGLITQRLSALSRKNVQVLPNRNDPNQARAGEVAQYCDLVLQRLRMAEKQVDGTYRYKGNVSSVVEALDMAFWYGISVLWIHWKEIDGVPTPYALEKIDERRYNFDVETQTVHIATDDDGSFPGTPLTSFDPALYVSITNTRVSSRLSMCGAGRAVLIPYALRQGSMKDLLTYAEVWASPGLVGKMSNEVSAAFNPDAVATFERLVEEFAADSRQILPPGFDVTVIGAQGGGTEVFKLVESITERQIEYALVGQTGVTSGDTATYASAEVGYRVQQTLIDGDAEMVAEALESMLLHAVHLRFGMGTPIPEIRFSSDPGLDSSLKRAQVLAAVAAPIAALQNVGYELDMEEIAKSFEIPIKKKAEG